MDEFLLCFFISESDGSAECPRDGFLRVESSAALLDFETGFVSSSSKSVLTGDNIEILLNKSTNELPDSVLLWLLYTTEFLFGDGTWHLKKHLKLLEENHRY